MNSQTKLFREQIQLVQQQHPLFQAPHPFWLDCFRGRLAMDDLRLWALDVYPIVRDFARLYLHVAAKCNSELILTSLGETIFEETGSGLEKESHPTLFRTFLKSLEIAENEIPATSSTKAGRNHWEFCWEIARDGSFLDGLTLVGIGIERPLPDFFQMIARAMQRHYRMNAMALKYFTVHNVADVKHALVAGRAVSELARTPAEQARVCEVLFRLWDLQKLQLDEIYRTAQLRCDMVVNRSPSSKSLAQKALSSIR